MTFHWPQVTMIVWLTCFAAGGMLHHNTYQKVNKWEALVTVAGLVFVLYAGGFFR